MSFRSLSKSKILVYLLYLIGVALIITDLFLDNILGNELSVGQRVFLCLLVLIYIVSTSVTSYSGKRFIETVLSSIFIGFSIYVLVFTCIIGYMYFTLGGPIPKLYIPLLVFNTWFVVMPIIEFIRRRRNKG